jgi:hypothetical protein
MLLKNQPLESRTPRLWTVAALVLVSAVLLVPKALAESLKDAVDSFNQQAANDQIGSREPPLLEDEVVAAIPGWRRDVDKVGDPTYAVFQKIADSKTLPEGAKLSFTTSWGTFNGYDFTVWWVDLSVKTGKNSGYKFRIRDRKISSKPSTSPVTSSAPTPQKPNDQSGKTSTEPAAEASPASDQSAPKEGSKIESKPARS